MEAQEESRSHFGHSLKCCLLFKMSSVVSQPSRSAHHHHHHHSWSNFTHSSSVPGGVGPPGGNSLRGIKQRENPVLLLQECEKSVGNLEIGRGVEAV